MPQKASKMIGTLVFFLLSTPAVRAQADQVIVADASAPAHPFPHYWEQMFGSGRAILTLRDSYRQDLREVKQITGFEYVRFHAVFHDEVGVYDEDAQGKPSFNFSYVDQIYDGLLSSGVRPFVELSFMPKKLALKEALHPFWYRQNVAPPKDWGKWDALITAFANHLVERYGIEEIGRWYFEVWNEPNLDFWVGEPRQATYWDLYDHTALALKAVSPRLRVGGPATAQAAWADEFIRHCAGKHIPVDFVSSHVYGNDRAQDVFGTDEIISRDRMVCRAVKKVHDQIKASPLPDLPLVWSEFNASYMNEPAVTDAVYMGPWLATTIDQCDGLVDMLSYWTFSDVFEEQGVVKTPLYGGFGLLAAGGIPKPAFNAFKLLHELGNQRINLDSDSALFTKRKDGSFALAVWNLFPPDQAGSAKRVTLRFKGLNARSCRISWLDASHGDIHPAYRDMGSPRYPTRAQIAQLRKAAEISPPERRDLKNGEVTITLPAHGLALLQLEVTGTPVHE